MLLLMVLALSVFMCSVQKEEKKEENNANGIPKKIVAGLDDSFVPMGFKNEKGEIVGFDIDLARAVAQKLGSQVEFKPINWDSKIMDLNSGNIDLIWNGLTITPDRAKETEISKPYMSNNQIIIVNINSPIKTKADLKGKIVGVQSQSSGEEKIKKENADKGFKELKTYPQYDQAFMDLGIGRVDAVIADGVIARYLMTKEPGKYKIVEGTDYGVDNFAVGFRKDDTALRDKINGILAEMKKDGTADKIAEKWLGSGADLDKSDAK